MPLLHNIKNAASDLGCVAGICDANPVPLAQSKTPFVSHDREKRTNPDRTLAGAKSVLVVLTGHPAPVNPPPPANKHEGVLSTLAAGSDYHKVLLGIFVELAAILSKHVSFRYKVLIDSGALPERVLAVKAKLARWGKNCMAISPQFGAYCNIGCMVTDIGLDVWQPGWKHKGEEAYNAADTKNRCGACEGCNMCIEACPSGCIARDGYSIDPFGCVSYLTQKKGPLLECEMDMMGTQLYGCDVCRAVCPQAMGPLHSCGSMSADESHIGTDAVLSMDEESFKSRFGHTPMSYIGLNTLKRNASVAARNIQRRGFT